MRIWPFSRSRKKEHHLREYTEPSFRGAILMLVISLGVLTLIWLAYSWALQQPGMNYPSV